MAPSTRALIVAAVLAAGLGNAQPLPGTPARNPPEHRPPAHARPVHAVGPELVLFDGSAATPKIGRLGNWVSITRATTGPAPGLPALKLYIRDRAGSVPAESRLLMTIVLQPVTHHRPGTAGRPLNEALSPVPIYQDTLGEPLSLEGYRDEFDGGHSPTKTANAVFKADASHAQVIGIEAAIEGGRCKKARVTARPGAKTVAALQLDPVWKEHMDGACSIKFRLCADKGPLWTRANACPRRPHHRGLANG